MSNDPVSLAEYVSSVMGTSESVKELADITENLAHAVTTQDKEIKRLRGVINYIIDCCNNDNDSYIHVYGPPECNEMIKSAYSDGRKDALSMIKHKISHKTKSEEI